MKIMIVDDSRHMRDFLSEALLKFPAEVCTAEDGETAVRRYADEKPDIVLMDVRMPRMDGITASAGIRRLNPSACIIIVTEHDVDEYREDARNAGAAAYFLKQNLVDLFRYLRNEYLNPN